MGVDNMEQKDKEQEGGRRRLLRISRDRDRVKQLTSENKTSRREKKRGSKKLIINFTT